MSQIYSPRVPTKITRQKILAWVKANPNSSVKEIEAGIDVREGVLCNVLSKMVKDETLSFDIGNAPPKNPGGRKGSVYRYWVRSLQTSPTPPLALVAMPIAESTVLAQRSDQFGATTQALKYKPTFDPFIIIHSLSVDEQDEMCVELCYLRAKRSLLK